MGSSGFAGADRCTIPAHAANVVPSPDDAPDTLIHCITLAAEMTHRQERRAR
ncbi:MAG: hypothetical protein PHV28_10410 [Kiritimatiellae bacterium]|nr:hypothetical protein [Kiritimatiellia bacterium]